MKEKKRHSEEPISNEVIDQASDRFLILHNDDINTFDYVIDTLIDVCEHEPNQAEQCTYIVHYKGKCDVKKGNFEYLHPIKNQLINKGLTVTID